MLLIEWLAWWSAISPLQAEENLNAYTVGVVSNPGWQTDREQTLSVWRRLAAGAVVFIGERLGQPEAEPDPYAPGALRRSAWRVWSWLRSEFGGSVS
jgi:hypothetical protein